MERDTALLKIKKCLALAGSSNPNEAAAAMRQAQKLMAMFGLNETDISLAEVVESAARARMTSLVNWEVIMSRIVADAFGCYVYGVVKRTLHYSNFTWRRERSYVFVGVGASAEIAAYAYDVLSRQCAKDRRNHIAKQPKTCKSATKTARGDMYAQGWCSGIRAKLESFAGMQPKVALLEEYFESRYGDVGAACSKNRANSGNTTYGDWRSGAQAGNAMELSLGLGKASPQTLLL